MNSQIEMLRSWNHCLFWLSVLLPLLGAAAGVARFYVDRKEKELVSATTRLELERNQGEINTLKKHAAPRHLTDSQKESISFVLKQASPFSVTVVSRLMDAEGSDYAKEIGNEFSQNNWDVFYNTTSLNDFVGFRIVYVGADNFDVPGKLVLQALSAAGLEVSIQPINPRSVSLQHEGVTLIMGRK